MPTPQVHHLGLVSPLRYPLRRASRPALGRRWRYRVTPSSNRAPHCLQGRIALCIAALLVWTTAWPTLTRGATASAQPTSPPPDTIAIDRELQAVIAELERLGVEEEVATELYLRAEDELAKAMAREQEVAAYAERAKAEVGRAYETLRKRLVEAYKRGSRFEILALALLEGRSMADAGAGAKFAEVMVQRDERAFQEWTAKAAELAELESELASVSEQKLAAAREASRRLEEVRQAIRAAEEYRSGLEERRKRMLEAYEQSRREAERAARERVVGSSRVVKVTGASSERVARAVEIALAQLGKPYRFGAAGPDEFDCSGLVLYAFSNAGFRGIPHRADLQYFLSDVHPVKDELLPGDLVFFSKPGTPEGIHHNGIYVGDGMMVHAPRTGDVVRLSSIARPDYFGATRLA